MSLTMPCPGLFVQITALLSPASCHGQLGSGLLRLYWLDDMMQDTLLC